MNKNKALIVEDNAINALVLKKAIAQEFEPVHVKNDREVFDALTRDTFQIVFMDINLGGHSLDGESIMRQLKADARYQHLPVVAVTSYALPGDRERFLAAGFDGYLAKPIQRQEVLAHIRGRLGS